MPVMINVVKDVLSMDSLDLDLLAQALATYDIRKASRLEFFLNAQIAEEDKRRLAVYNEIMKEAA